MPCTKPNCNCLEIAEKRNGGEPIKYGYQCLGLTEAELQNLKAPAPYTRQNNMDVEVKGDKIVITLPFNKKGKDSKSGKTLVHATTSGNKETAVEVNGKKLTIGVNCYTFKGE